MIRLVLFIHGFIGDENLTWGRFPDLIKADTDIGLRFDVKSFGYRTDGDLQHAANELKTFIEINCATYDSIVIVAHSQGGLIARRYIADRLQNTDALRIKGFLSFATPHLGVGMASAGKWIPGAAGYVEDLALGSKFLARLRADWCRTRAEEFVHTRYVVAADDRVVGQWSALGAEWNEDYIVISEVGHRSIVKPNSAAALSFQVCKRFLLDTSGPRFSGNVDHRQPVLERKTLDNTPANRFVFSARAIPFMGRELAIAELTSFLNKAAVQFGWHLIHGAGGVGKSRLALELCLAAENEWHAGFLHESADQPDWARWQPAFPTLIIVDYASTAPEITGDMLRALAGRSAENALRRPVRVLLLERSNTGDWLKKLIGAGSSSKRLIEAQTAPDFELLTIADPWPLMAHVIGHAGKPLPDRDETLRLLEQIDLQKRPLFAFFLADAIAEGGIPRARKWDAAQLLADVIDRARDKFWQPAGAGPSEECVLALATMVGGLSVEALRDLTSSLLPQWDINRHPRIYRVMTGSDATERIRPLEPDIVGEHFLLQTLGRSDLLGEIDRKQLCDLAWSVDAIGVARFSLRAHHDVTGHPSLTFLRWAPKRGYLGPIMWARAAVNLIHDFGGQVDLGAARILLDNMKLVSEREPNRLSPTEMREFAQPSLKGLWAEGAVNLVSHLRETDPHTARLLVEEMKAFADQHSDDAYILQRWLQASQNLINAASLDTSELSSILNEIKEVVRQRPEESSTRQLWAETAVNLITFLDENDSSGRLALLSEMKQLAGQHPQDSRLRELWASAAFNQITTLSNYDVSDATALLFELKRLSEQYPAEPLLRGLWSRSAHNIIAQPLISERHDYDQSRALALLDEIQEIVYQFPDERDLWKWWCNAAVLLIHDLYGPCRVPTGLKILGEIKRFADRYPTESYPRETWAGTAVKLILDLGSHDLPAAQILLDDIKALANAHPDAPHLRQSWAECAMILIVFVQTSQPSRAYILLGKIKRVADQYFYEPALREVWAKAALNLALGLRTRQPSTARAIFAKIKALADQHPHEPSLRGIPWAQAAYNLIWGLRTQDPSAARALLDDMKAVAEGFLNEPFLRYWWGLSAINILVAMGEGTFSETRQIYEQVARVAATFPSELMLNNNWAAAHAWLLLRAEEAGVRTHLLKEPWHLDLPPEIVAVSEFMLLRHRREDNKAEQVLANWCKDHPAAAERIRAILAVGFGAR